jgi:hypothetical protein
MNQPAANETTATVTNPSTSISAWVIDAPAIAPCNACRSRSVPALKAGIYDGGRSPGWHLTKSRREPGWFRGPARGRSAPEANPKHRAPFGAARWSRAVSRCRQTPRAARRGELRSTVGRMGGLTVVLKSLSQEIQKVAFGATNGPWAPKRFNRWRNRSIVHRLGEAVFLGATAAHKPSTARKSPQPSTAQWGRREASARVAGLGTVSAIATTAADSSGG